MSATVDEKTLSQESQLLGTPKFRNHNVEKAHRIKKVAAILGSALLILWFFHATCLNPNVLRFDDIFDPRRRYIDIGSDVLNGCFDLFDILAIKGRSGIINVSINPQPADAQNPVPADLLLETRNGQINVDFATFDVPERDYHVSISSRGGSIAGHILHGRLTTMESRSGIIQMQLTPYAEGNHTSTLRTSSRSGSQHLTILSPAKKPEGPMESMSSFHTSRSGPLFLRYPPEWEGTIEGRTKSAAVHLHGNLDIIHQDSTSTSGHYILARKGNGSNILNFYSRSGLVDIYFD